MRQRDVRACRCITCEHLQYISIRPSVKAENALLSGYSNDSAEGLRSRAESRPELACPGGGGKAKSPPHRPRRVLIVLTDGSIRLNICGARVCLSEQEGRLLFGRAGAARDLKPTVSRLAPWLCRRIVLTAAGGSPIEVMWHWRQTRLGTIARRCARNQDLASEEKKVNGILKALVVVLTVVTAGFACLVTQRRHQ
jgi:hypothetical protein